MHINGLTEIIAHIGFPTHSFKAPMIYNPWFEKTAVNAVVVPMGCQIEHFPSFLRSLFLLSNIRGALITMPHKIATLALLDEVLPAAAIAGACNAVKRLSDGRLQGDLFDGEGFVRGALSKGVVLAGSRALIVGSGGVGCAIAASMAAAAVGELSLFDVNATACESLAQRLRLHYPQLKVKTGSNDPAGFDVVVNATPLGMNEGDPLPVDMTRMASNTFVGEVVMRTETTAFLAAALERGCKIQIGTDMLFEQIPAYLEFFGLPSTTADELRRLSQVKY
jgi:shikimate dehydrogenase